MVRLQVQLLGEALVIAKLDGSISLSLIDARIVQHLCPGDS